MITLQWRVFPNSNITNANKIALQNLNGTITKNIEFSLDIIVFCLVSSIHDSFLPVFPAETSGKDNLGAERTAWYNRFE